jgi:hypothetical protein
MCAWTTLFADKIAFYHQLQKLTASIQSMLMLAPSKTDNETGAVLAPAK